MSRYIYPQITRREPEEKKVSITPRILLGEIVTSADLPDLFRKHDIKSCVTIAETPPAITDSLEWECHIAPDCHLFIPATEAASMNVLQHFEKITQFITKMLGTPEEIDTKVRKRTPDEISTCNPLINPADGRPILHPNGNILIQSEFATLGTTFVIAYLMSVNKQSQYHTRQQIYYIWEELATNETHEKQLQLWEKYNKGNEGQYTILTANGKVNPAILNTLRKLGIMPPSGAPGSPGSAFPPLGFTKSPSRPYPARPVNPRRMRASPSKPNSHQPVDIPSSARLTRALHETPYSGLPILDNNRKGDPVWDRVSIVGKFHRAIGEFTITHTQDPSVLLTKKWAQGQSITTQLHDTMVKIKKINPRLSAQGWRCEHCDILWDN